MNEYRVTLGEGAARREITVTAATAAAARARAEEETGEDVVALRFVRAIGVSCRVRA